MSHNKTKIYWILFFIFMVIDIYFAFMSWSEIRASIGWVRHIPQKTSFKLRHIVQYTPQSYLLLTCLSSTFKFTKVMNILITIIVISSIGIISEIIQYFDPQRIFSFMDMFWNFFAALIGVGLYLVIPSPKRR